MRVRAGAVCISALVAGTALVISGCAAKGPAEYLYHGSSEVVMLQWGQPGSNGRIRGTLTMNTLDGTPPSQTVRSNTQPFTGRISGDSITLNSRGWLTDWSLTGTLSGQTLKLQSVGSNGQQQATILSSAGASDYNAALRTLRGRVRGRNAAEAQREADAAQQQADAESVQTASTDLANVTSIGFSADLRAMRRHLITMSNDLADEQAAAAKGPNADGGFCYNLDENVEYDAQESVEYDLQEDIGYDVNEIVKPDIQTARQMLSALRGDVYRLNQSNLPFPGDATSAFQAGQQKIAHAITVANKIITQANAYDVQAYQVADSIAVGNCAGDGIGKPTDLLHLIPAPVTAALGSTASYSD